MSNTPYALAYENLGYSRSTTRNMLWISLSPWRGFCGGWEVFGDLHYITL